MHTKTLPAAPMLACRTIDSRVVWVVLIDGLAELRIKEEDGSTVAFERRALSNVLDWRSNRAEAEAWLTEVEAGMAATL